MSTNDAVASRWSGPSPSNTFSDETSSVLSQGPYARDPYSLLASRYAKIGLRTAIVPCFAKSLRFRSIILNVCRMNVIIILQIVAISCCAQGNHNAFSRDGLAAARPSSQLWADYSVTDDLAEFLRGIRKETPRRFSRKVAIVLEQRRQSEVFQPSNPPLDRHR